MRSTVVGSWPGADLGLAVADQLEAGIDLLSDGQPRGDMISSFLQAIPGCERRGARWAITGRVGMPSGPITAPDWQRAAALAGPHKVKGILTGPTTLACAVTIEPGAPYSGPGDPALVDAFAAVLTAEAEALTKSGATIIQIDEPFFSIGADLTTGLAAVAKVASAIKEPWLHCCGDLRTAWPALRGAPVSVLHMEGTNPERLPADLTAAPDRAFGVIDSTTDEVERLEVVLARIRRLPVRSETWLAPDCGFRLRSRPAARAKLALLTEAVRSAYAEGL